MIESSKDIQYCRVGANSDHFTQWAIEMMFDAIEGDAIEIMTNIMPGLVLNEAFYYQLHVKFEEFARKIIEQAHSTVLITQGKVSKGLTEVQTVFRKHPVMFTEDSGRAAYTWNDKGERILLKSNGPTGLSGAYYSYPSIYLDENSHLGLTSFSGYQSLRDVLLDGFISLIFNSRGAESRRLIGIFPLEHIWVYLDDEAMFLAGGPTQIVVDEFGEKTAHLVSTSTLIELGIISELPTASEWVVPTTLRISNILQSIRDYEELKPPTEDTDFELYYRDITQDKAKSILETIILNLPKGMPWDKIRDLGITILTELYYGNPLGNLGVEFLNAYFKLFDANLANHIAVQAELGYVHAYPHGQNIDIVGNICDHEIDRDENGQVSIPYKGNAETRIKKINSAHSSYQNHRDSFYNALSAIVQGLGS